MKQQLLDAAKLLVTALSTFGLFLAANDITVPWLHTESLDAFGVFLGAFILLALSLYGIWMNTYTRWKSFKKADEKKRQRLKEENKTQ